MLAVGTPVVLSRAGEQQLGIIVGGALVEGSALYEVSLEDVVRKGIWEDELQLATPETIEAILGWLARDPELQVTQLAGRSGARRLYLRAAYMEDLTRALSALRDDEKASSAQMPYEVGEQVAVHREDTWSLGTVLGARTSSGEMALAVDVMGDMQSLPLSALAPLADSPRTVSGLALGVRVRFLVAGHEQDDDYAATLCSCYGDSDEGETLFCIAFDDGDILEELSESDLIPI